MTNTPPIDLRTPVFEDEESAAWKFYMDSDNGSRLEKYFRSGDAIMARMRECPVNVDNFINNRTKSRDRSKGIATLGDLEKPMDDKLDAFLNPNDNHSIIVVNPTSMVFRDLIWNENLWESVTLVNSRDYRKEVPLITDALPPPPPGASR